MARSIGTSVENNFIAGRVSDTTGLNTPENAVVDEANCVFDEYGRVRRRYGIDYEPSYTILNVTRNGGYIVEYEWKNAAGLADTNFLVQQFEDTLYFYAIDRDDSLSNNKASFTVNLTTHKTSSAPNIRTAACQFASGRGYLYVVHPFMEPLRIEYDSTGPSITVTEIVVEVRDFDGIDDSLDIDERPTSSLSDAHKYNLYNQGWYATITPKGGSATNAVTAWDAARSDWPSNADVWWLYKDANEDWDSGLIDKYALPLAPAPQGHYILEAFNQDRATASGIAGLAAVTSSVYRPSTVEFFAGRVWYSGVNYGEYANKLYFSQVIEKSEQVGYCYQASDPTTENGADLIQSDGGEISIPNAGSIIRLFATQNAMIVFTTNGIWAIQGSQGVGFSANDYSISRLSSLQTPSNLSFVEVEGLPVWWADAGIFTLQADQVGSVTVSSLTNQKIKQFYNDIPLSSKLYVKGAYNFYDKIIQWVYRSTAPTTEYEKFNFDRVLCYNVLTGAFYHYEVDISTLTINGVFTTGGLGYVEEEENVLDGSSNPVLDSEGNNVTATVMNTRSFPSVFRYTTTYQNSGTSYRLTFSLEADDAYVDWYTYDTAGVNFDSYAVSGYKVHGEAQRKFQTNYLYTFFEDQAGASCYCSVIWDWNYRTYGERIYSRQQVYSENSNRQVQFSRRKLRGSGLSAQLYFESEDGKPFRLLGWSIEESANNKV